jgi:hypothetical protein
MRNIIESISKINWNLNPGGDELMATIARFFHEYGVEMNIVPLEIENFPREIVNEIAQQALARVDIMNLLTAGPHGVLFGGLIILILGIGICIRMDIQPILNNITFHAPFELPFHQFTSRWNIFFSRVSSLWGQDLENSMDSLRVARRYLITMLREHSNSLEGIMDQEGFRNIDNPLVLHEEGRRIIFDLNSYIVQHRHDMESLIAQIQDINNTISDRWNIDNIPLEITSVRTELIHIHNNLTEGLNVLNTYSTWVANHLADYAGIMCNLF